MGRITLNDNLSEAVIKIVDGNPGAMNAICDMMSVADRVDPQSFMGQLTPVIALDEHGIYGTDIYVLWSDKCGRDPRKVLMLIRAVQLGLLDASRLKEIAGDQERILNLSDEEFAELDEQVCERLTEFERPKE